MNRIAKKHHSRVRRHARVRAAIAGSAARPRLSVFRSLQHISAQLIDDATGTTLVSVSEHEVKVKGTKSERAKAVGQLVAEKAKAKNISTVIFDRGGNRFHGRMKALADGAREAGLQF